MAVTKRKIVSLWLRCGAARTTLWSQSQSTLTATLVIKDQGQYIQSARNLRALCVYDLDYRNSCQQAGESTANVHPSISHRSLLVSMQTRRDLQFRKCAIAPRACKQIRPNLFAKHCNHSRTTRFSSKQYCKQSVTKTTRFLNLHGKKQA